MNNSSSFNHVQYCNSNSVLIINPAGRLKQVFTPFRVVAASEGQLRWYIVDEVRNTKDDRLVYIINGVPYYHHHFTIGVQF